MPAEIYLPTAARVAGRVLAAGSVLQVADEEADRLIGSGVARLATDADAVAPPAPEPVVEPQEVAPPALEWPQYMSVERFVVLLAERLHALEREVFALRRERPR